ncbi:leucine-rich repeat-containing protein 73 [Sinocyclocheilus grahami]|uniref:leucine-rich repeat-containing protein 73 n=1 Tax=Sinocyclocheilus grahami TaxID=75366 RepID=UPI0007AC96CC|nr:PREDICTED: leucine-rich repeat-containing protein 73 [Sinocyclocheilus grahami]
MLPGSIQITGEALSGAEIKDICDSLKENSVRLLSVRGCQLSDRDFGRVCRGVAESHSLAQLNLNLGVVSTIGRTKQLADALKANRSVQTLFLHGRDHIAGMLTVAVASSRTLEVLDLEGTGLTNQSAQVFLDMVENYPTSLRVLVLAENDISPELQQQISDLLSEGEEEEDKDGEARGRFVTPREKPAWVPHSITGSKRLGQKGSTEIDITHALFGRDRFYLRNRNMNFL